MVVGSGRARVATAARNSLALSQSRSQMSFSLSVRMKRSTTALPVGRPTGAKVWVTCQRVQSAVQSTPCTAAVVGTKLDTLGHVRRRAERGDELLLDRREHRRPVLVDRDLDDGRAVTAVDDRHECDHAIATRPDGSHVRREPTKQLLDERLVAFSYSTLRSREKTTKTDSSKHISVHSTLAAMLAEWKLGGWAAMMGRHPEPDDLIVPMPPEHAARRRTRTSKAFRVTTTRARVGGGMTSPRSDGGTAGTTTCGLRSSRLLSRMGPTSTSSRPR